MFQKTGRPLWRISTAPSSAPKLVASIARKIDVPRRSMIGLAG